MKLYKHQEEAVSEILYELEVEEKKNIIGEMFTSFGKSLVMSELAKNLDGRVLILVNITPLIDQIAEHLDEIGCDYSVLKAGYEDKFDHTKKIQLVMSQTYFARVDKIKFDKVDYILQDEAHREWETARTKKVLLSLNPKGRAGFTATPYDGVGYALENCEYIVRTKSAKELEEDGYIVPVRYYVPEWSEKVDYSELRMSGSDYSGEAIDEMINTQEFLDLTVKSMNQMNAKEKKTLVFANSIEHADAIADALKKDGYSVISYHSKTNPIEAQEAMESFKEGKCISKDLFGSSTPIKCIVAVSKISIGFSVKDIELGVMCRPTKRRSLWVQIVGRMVRAYPNKEYAELLDLAQCVKTHGFANEPYFPPKKGDKKALEEEKDRLACEVVPILAGKEPTLLTREIIDVKVKELQRKEKTIPQLSMDELTSIFEMTTNLDVIIHIGYEVHKRVVGGTYKPSHIEWVAVKWREMIEDFPQYKERLIRTMKTRIKNIVKGGKKMHSLHFFPEWIRQQEPYSLHEKFEIDDDEIPF